MTTVLFAILGVVVGSFLNVCSDRLPARQSLLRPSSHCPQCGYVLAPYDIIPVISYLWLRGRCRKCGYRIPPRVFVIELITALLFAALAWRYGVTWPLAVATLYTCLLLVISIVDFEHGLILNWLVYPALGCGLALSVVWPGLGIISSLIGAAAGFAVITLIILVSRGGMGWGDAKLAAFSGAINGFPMVFLALLIAVVPGGITAAVLLATRRKGRRDAIPFGPFLALGAWVALLWGQELITWYLSAVGRTSG